MSDADFVKIFTGNQIDTQLLKTNLEAIGIDPIVKQDSHLGVSAYLVTDYQELMKIYVHKSELERANTVLNETFESED